MKSKNSFLVAAVAVTMVLGLNASAAEMSFDTKSTVNGVKGVVCPAVENATFGSLTDLDAAGNSPDFVKAKGTNGVEGYICSEDLPQPAANPQAAQEYMETLTSDSHREIPLYASDGVTVIGEFRVFMGYDG